MIRILTCTAVFLASVSPGTADVTAPSGRTIDCYCTDRAGSRVELGQEICLFVDGRAFMARCEMSLNNPMWRETGLGCLSSQSQHGEPGPDAPLVHSEI